MTTNNEQPDDEIVYIELPIMAADKAAAESVIKRDYAKRIKGRPVEFSWVHNAAVYMTIKNKEC